MSEHDDNPSGLHGEEIHEDTREPENLILFFFVAVIWGAMLTFFLSRYKVLPYTVCIFFSGIAISAIVGQIPDDQQDTFTHSARTWQEIDPHLMLYLFLPILIYGDAISLNWTQVKGALLQTMILAGPGVLMGAFMMGLFIYYCTNLGWSWYVSMLFGSILSGTDPVAVVALLKDVNTSPRLFLLIIGESLLNDGTCIVMYTLYFDLLEGKTFSPRDIIAFFVKMLCASPALGVVCGLVSIYCLRAACRSLSTTDRTIQIIVTISCSYLAFYFSEKLLHLSGILACGAAGLMISKQGMPYLVDHETIHLIWELLEWFGNTMIFFLAGVVYGGKAVHYSVTGDDFALLILIYVMLMIMRAVTVACLYPFISVIGLKCSLKEAIFMSWSGLRGALGMALGLAVFGERELLRLEKTTADKFFFFVGGICTLTLLINALTAPYLLEALGLILTTNSSVEFGSVQKKVDHQLKLALEKEIEKFSGGGHNGHGSNGHGGAGEGRVDSVSLHFPVNTEEVKRHISLFDAPDASSVQSPTTIRRVARQTSTEPRLTIHGHLVTSDRRLVYCRHMFLTILRAQYWKSIHEGRVPRNEKVAQCLLYSVEHSIHNTAEALSDWSIVCKELSTPQWRDQVDRYLLSVTPEWFSLHNLGISESAENTYDRIYILINYISAHEKCQHEIYEFLDDEEQLLAKRHSASARPPSGVLAGGVEGEDNNIWLERSNQKVFHEIEVVIDESKANVQLALEFLQSLDHSLVTTLIWIIQARVLLGTQAEKVEHLVEEGFLTPEAAEGYLETIRHDIQRLENVKYESNREEVKLQIEALKTTESILPREMYANLRVPKHQIRSLDGPSTHPSAATGRGIVAGGGGRSGGVVELADAGSTRPSEVMLPKTPQESLPPGWRVDLEMVQTGGAVVVAESPKGTKAIGKKEIEKMVNNECLIMDEKNVVMRYLKWSLHRVANIQSSSASASVNKEQASSPPSPLVPVPPPERGNKRPRPHDKDSRGEQQQVRATSSTDTAAIRAVSSSEIHPPAALWTDDPAMESARRKEFLRWLKLLQFDRNILCYGIGSKQLLIRNFAATALQDEDVIELSASMLQDKDSSSSLPSLFSAGGAHWKRNGEEVLWNLFHLIRRGILSSSSQGSRIPPSTIWSRKSDGSVYPLESEARLVSDYLCLHYNWQRSGMGRRHANQLEAIREVIIQQSNSSSTGTTTPLLGGEDSDSVSISEDPTPLQPSAALTARSRSLSSREATDLLASQRQPGALNWDYVNSVSRLYLLIHDLEDIFQTSAQNSAHIYKALSILAACPVVSIVASMASLNTPLHAGWDATHLHAFQWSYEHTPTSLPHDPLPEVVSAFNNESRKTHTDRADTLKYILNSLTKKHHEILMYLLTCSSPAPISSSSTPSPSQVATSSPSPAIASAAVATVGWGDLLAHATTQFIVKGDSDLRQLVSELKDQRIVRTFTNKDSKVFLVLLLSPVEKVSAMDYYHLSTPQSASSGGAALAKKSPSSGGSSSGGRKKKS